MTMTYTTLTGPKTLSGSIASWSSYTLLDTATILDEAQTLIYQTLRTREMKASAVLTVPAAAASAALPSASTGQFLEPILLRDDAIPLTFIPNDERFVSQQKLAELRVYTATVLATGTPGYVSIFDEAFQFDVLSTSQRLMTLVYFKRPELLATSTNESNWLTYRYPHIVRAACIAASHSFMMEYEAYQQALGFLNQLIQAANAEVGNLEGMGAKAKINSDPAIEGSLLSFLSTSTVPVQAVLKEAQALIFSRLRTREMKTSATVTLASGSSSVALPGASTGLFLEAISLHDDTNGNTLIPSDERNVSEQKLLQIRQYSSGVLTTGTPGYLSIFDEEFQFDVKAAATTTMTLVYFKRPANLTAASQTNFLTERYPAILRTAAQAALANFQRNAPLYEQLLNELTALCDAANQEAALPATTGITSPLNQPGLEGSLLTFIPTNTPPVQSVLKEAQTLVYSLLRVREMHETYQFRMQEGESFIAVPSRFLDPIGDIYAPSLNLRFAHIDSNRLLRRRTFSEETGNLATGAITTVSGSTQITVTFTAHDFTQGSPFTITGATAVGGITPNGTFEIISIATNSFVLETVSMTATSSTSGGGAAMEYICENLTKGTPSTWTIMKDRIYFDSAFNDDAYVELEYFQSLQLLTDVDETNFLTERYPQVLRAAAQTAAANIRKDHPDYQACMSKLQVMVQATSIENDLMYRGALLQTDTPHGVWGNDYR